MIEKGIECSFKEIKDKKFRRAIKAEDVDRYFKNKEVKILYIVEGIQGNIDVIDIDNLNKIADEEMKNIDK